MRFHWPCLALLALCFAATGCLGTRLRPGEVLYVYVSSNGRITLEGEPVVMNDLPARLKKAGATPDTPIVFKTQGEISDRMMRSLVEAVQSQGYSRAVFESPRHADAFVPDPDASGGPELERRSEPVRRPNIRSSPRNIGAP
ncbi:MAG: ExbD/TolR family protein [Kiritimatiellia bacterium]|jgi:hypothetical protein